ncbi:MAG TPA: protein kinase [Thermoanaerobaculia bacterium]|jgi:tetratricopeptide (TPR) repeat protein
MAQKPIDSERWRRVKEIFGQALDLPSAEVPAFLAEACGGDDALRGEVEALLAADRTAASFLATPARELAGNLLEEETLEGPPPPRGLVGSTLSHYRILDRLGAGGMGEVYLAEDERLGRRVALKVLRLELGGHEERLERFRREARVVATLSHPNIVTIHSVEEDQGVHFLTMELVEGDTLRAKIVPGGLATDEFLRLAVPLADAVAAAHGKGITHRDLKPANVMISTDGRVKVLDFGIAKLSAASREAPPDLTREGWVLGTVSYMSPEQLAGKPADHRSDIFSLGTVLFEMATGEHPFMAPSAAEVMSKILRDPPGPAKAELPQRLGRILGRCLEKDPDLRYQDARDLCEDLRALQRELDEAAILGSHSSGVFGEAGRPRRLSRRGLSMAAALMVAALAGAVLLWTGRPPQKAPESASAAAPAALDSPAPTAPARATVAVLHFQNLTGDPKLDWLRTGLTEMLVTDLSQSSRLDVLGTDRLYQILADLGALSNRPTSFDLVQKVAQRAAVQQVILGSYAQVGGNVRISFQIEDAATGRILGSDRIQGRGDEQLLLLVDELIAAVHRHLEIETPAAAPARVQEVTTSSAEALRLFTEARNLHYKGKESEAILLLEKAVTLDPTFALALADLAALHSNLGHGGLAESYTRRAVEQAERLPLNQRHLIQGRYYERRWATYSRAIAAFQEAVRLYPDEDRARTSLAAIASFLERYASALKEYETLLSEGTKSAPVTINAANVAAALGRFEHGYRLLQDLAAREPDSWLAQVGLGWHLTHWGKLDEAAAALQRAAALRPGDFFVGQSAWRLAVLREDWPQTERTAAELAGLDDSSAQWRGALSRARNSLYHGASEEALVHLAAAAHAYPQPEAFTAMAHCWTADLLLDRGEAARALAEAQRAQELARDDWPELQGLFLAAQAQQELGRPLAADAIVAALKRRAAVNPNAVEERQIHHLEGLLALARGNPAGAVAALRRAAALLPPRGVEIHWHVQPDHVPIWFALGRAELAAGRREQARQWFAKVAASGAEHIEFPIAYVRSFYFLGKIQAGRGETAEARRSFARFLGFWQSGDLDRPRIAEALAASGRAAR